jgi:hypothetical protein
MYKSLYFLAREKDDKYMSSLLCLATCVIYGTNTIILIMWRACNLTAFIHNSTGPVVHPFASSHEGPGFNPHGGIYVKPEFSC